MQAAHCLCCAPGACGKAELDYGSSQTANKRSAAAQYIQCLSRTLVRLIWTLTTASACQQCRSVCPLSERDRDQPESLHFLVSVPRKTSTKIAGTRRPTAHRHQAKMQRASHETSKADGMCRFFSRRAAPSLVAWQYPRTSVSVRLSGPPTLQG